MSAMPVIRRESAPASSRFRSPPSDPRSAVRVPPQRPPGVEPQWPVRQDVLRTRLLATVTDKSPATPLASNRLSGHSRSLRQFLCPVYLVHSSRIFAQVRCPAESSGAQMPGSRRLHLALYHHPSIEISALPSVPFPST